MQSPYVSAIAPDDHVLGDVKAPITLVMYGDYESPECGTLQALISIALRAFRGRLCVVFRHFPLVIIHPHAERAAEMAEAAGEHGRFWAMHDVLFQHQDALSDRDLARYAAMVGMEPDWAIAAIRVHAFAARVRRDFLGGVHRGVTGAPTMFINERRYDDAYDETSLLLALQNARYTASWIGR